MCLAIPGKILSVTGHMAMADFDGTTKQIVVALLPNIQPNEYVIVHAGYAIQKVDEEAAKESLTIWKEMLEKDLVEKADYV